MTTIDLERWVSKNGKEAIIVLSGEYWLVHIETREGEIIGKSLEEAKEKLKGLGKQKEFLGL